MHETLRRVRVAVIGCGYLGTTHAACLAELGHEVLGVEIDEERRAGLAAGQAPFYEPGLADLLARHVGSGRLRFTDSPAEAAAFAEMHFLCVGTPQLAESPGADTRQLVTAVTTLAPYLTGEPLVVGKSTVPVGTAARLAGLLASHAPDGSRAELAWNPEFLREGCAVQDTLRPDRIVLGVSSPGAADRLRECYAVSIAVGTPVVTTDLVTAELVKGAANAFLATKVSFVNAVAELCEVVGADVGHLADALGHDARIGRRHLDAGIGFGGGCLPKDLRAFVHRAGELGVEDAMAFLREVDAVNQRRREHVVRAAAAMVQPLPGAVIAVWGAAFKPDSDDVRDSPALWIAGQLQLRGAEVRVYDPQATESARAAYPTLDYAADAIAACQDAALLLHLTEWPEFRELDPAVVGAVMARRQVIDGRNRLDADTWQKAGWSVRTMGRFWDPDLQ